MLSGLRQFVVRADDVFTQGPISSHTRRFLVIKFPSEVPSNEGAIVG